MDYTDLPFKVLKKERSSWGSVLNINWQPEKKTLFLAE